MNLQLKEKYVVLTGGAKGIGRGIVESLAGEGAFPIVVGRNAKDNANCLEAIVEQAPGAFFVTGELSDAGECERVCQEIIEKTQNNVYGLVNNAGLNDGVGLETGDYQKFIQSLHNSLTHYYLMAHFLLPAMKAQKGSILNIGSKTAETGQGNTSGYAAANGGRNGLTREWAIELAPYSIRSNAIIVSECFTPQYEKWISQFDDAEERLKNITRNIPLEQRMTTMKEIGDMATFLLSPLSSHTTGQLIHVDGGYVHLDRAYNA